MVLAIEPGPMSSPQGGFHGEIKKVTRKEALNGPHQPHRQSTERNASL
jgi:hypothetical protein